MYRLTSSDISNVGGPMGHPNTRAFTLFHKYFYSLSNAKEYAEKDYHGPHKFKWRKDNGRWLSPDLGYVMYHIEKVKVEDEC